MLCTECWLLCVQCKMHKTPLAALGDQVDFPTLVLALGQILLALVQVLDRFPQQQGWVQTLSLIPLARDVSGLQVLQQAHWL